jgi:Cupin-like domain
MQAIEARVEEVTAERPGVLPEGMLHSRQPLLVRRLVSHWPLVTEGCKGGAASIDYLSGFSREQNIVAFRGAPEIEGRFFYNEDLTGLNFERTNLSLNAALNEFRSLGEAEDQASVYVGSTAVNSVFPGLLDENPLDFGVPNALVSIWMGSRARIAAHFDYPDNIAAVVAGRRRFTLFPPEQISNLYVGPVDFTPAGQAISLVDSQDPDFERFPRYREALAHAQVAELEPGDALFIPSLWWHQVEGLDDFNVLVNYWWKSVASVQGNPMDALIHCLLTFNGLPDGQRQAWRSIFDHYLFDNDAGDSSHQHIPQASRGILGAMDPATVAQLRAMLRSRLDG